MFSGGQRFALVLYRYGRWIEFQACEHLRLTSHLQCPVEQLACDAAQWQSSSRLGSAVDASPAQADGPPDRAPNQRQNSRNRSGDDFQKEIAPHGTEIMGDIPNYTDISPQIQISEIVVG
jgi:hypothetical protein